MFEVDYIECANCIEAMRSLPENSIDLVVTDPPYRLVGGGNTTNKCKVGGILSRDCEYARQGKLFEFNNIRFSDWIPEVFRILKNGTHAYIMCNSRNLFDLWGAASAAGFKFVNLLVWKKNNKTPNRYYMQQCEFILLLRKGAARDINNMGLANWFDIANIKDKQHPTQKPVELIKIFIEQSSAEGETVLDPFLGVGTTAIAAMLADRHYIGFELSQEFFNIACKKLDEIEEA